MYSSCIFDVDGTLWDSTEAVAAAWRTAAAKEGAPTDHITNTRLQAEFGKTMEDIGRSLFNMLPEEQSLRVIKSCCDYEVDYLAEHPVRVFSDVPKLFEELRREKIEIFIVSNCQAGYIEVMLDTNALAPFVRAHLCPGDTGLAKAGNIRQICDQYALSSPVYIGDTEGDETAADEAGVPFIWASYGFGSARDPESVLNRPLDLPGLLRKSPLSPPSP